MITPSFRLEQTDSHLLIFIRAPYAKLNEVEISVDENDFRFHCKPYFLRLNLPGKILENDENNTAGTYDFDEKTFKFKFEKLNAGEQFEGLDLLTKLLTSTQKSSKPKSSGTLIEEISSNNNETPDKDTHEESEDEIEDGDEWFIEQNVNSDNVNDIDLNSISVKYGFAQTKTNVFSKLSSEYSLIIDLPDPDNTKVAERQQLRIQSEIEKFDEDHYLADYFDESKMIQELLDYKPEFASPDYCLNYTENEIDCLKSLPKKTYLLDKEQKMYAFAGLVDILFAYCYNNRVNCGEKNVESGWNISKLSSTLSWFDTFSSIQDVIIASFRRSLCFPLYRNWELCKAVLADLIKLFKKGRKLIIKCLIEIRQSFNDGDCRYILNDLYINDYCVWIQYVSERHIQNLAEYLENLKFTKSMIDLDLECTELAGKLALEEQNASGSSDESSEDEEAESDEETSDEEPKDKQERSEKDKPKESSEENEFLISQELSELNIDCKPKHKPKIIELN